MCGYWWLWKDGFGIIFGIGIYVSIFLIFGWMGGVLLIVGKILVLLGYGLFWKICGGCCCRGYCWCCCWLRLKWFGFDVSSVCIGSWLLIGVFGWLKGEFEDVFLDVDCLFLRVGGWLLLFLMWFGWLFGFGRGLCGNWYLFILIECILFGNFWFLKMFDKDGRCFWMLGGLFF